MQSFTIPDAGTRAPLLGAVGPLQFEVLQYRLETEYGATTRLETAPWSILRWVDPAGEPLTADMLPSSCRLVLDARRRVVEVSHTQRTSTALEPERLRSSRALPA